MSDTHLEIIGLMSGTSLDGLDLACVRFAHTPSGIQHSLIASETVAYAPDLMQALQLAHRLSAEDLAHLDIKLGKYFGQEVKTFISKYNLTPHYIGSHGHTIFHQPERGLTLQIGNPFHLAVQSKIPVIAHFRDMNVALGGQGAPLVPIADALLYHQYEACLNLGGVANVTIQKEPIHRMASDLCICNIALNALSQRMSLAFDAEGFHASQGKVLEDLLAKLIEQPFYRENGPKSIGKEFYEKNVEPFLEKYLQHATLNDVMRTAVEYMAIIIGRFLSEHKIAHCLVTGGGAYNTFLIQRIQSHTSAELVLGSKVEIEFKEAIAFALLAYLKVRNENNIFKSVTGAPFDHCGGVLFAI